MTTIIRRQQKFPIVNFYILLSHKVLNKIIEPPQVSSFVGDVFAYEDEEKRRRQVLG